MDNKYTKLDRRKVDWEKNHDCVLNCGAFLLGLRLYRSPVSYEHRMDSKKIILLGSSVKL